jgi:hypothetical protein
MTERVATSADVASALGLSASTVQLYARQERIPFTTTPGGHRRYSVSEVQLALSAATDGQADSTDDYIVALSLNPLTGGLGAGQGAPISANAHRVRAQRIALLENAADVDDATSDPAIDSNPSPLSSYLLGAAGAHHGSALASMVAHSRSLALHCVKS